MFCTNCGKEIDANARFCPYCSTPINENHYFTPTQSSIQNKKMHGTTMVSLFLAIANAPILFIIRMMNLESKAEYTWAGEHAVYYVPDNIKAIMYVIMALITIASLFLLAKESKKSTIIGIVILNIISIIICLCVISITGP